jgi:hypothetical protein
VARRILRPGDNAYAAIDAGGGQRNEDVRRVAGKDRRELCRLLDAGGPEHRLVRTIATDHEVPLGLRLDDPGGIHLDDHHVPSRVGQPSGENATDAAVSAHDDVVSELSDVARQSTNPQPAIW